MCCDISGPRYQEVFARRREAIEQHTRFERDNAMWHVGACEKAVAGGKLPRVGAELDAKSAIGHPGDLAMRMLMQRANRTRHKLHPYQHQIIGVRQNLTPNSCTHSLPGRLAVQHKGLIAIGRLGPCAFRQNRCHR